MSANTTGSEVAEKRRRVQALCEKNGLDGVLLTSIANVAWFSGGADLHVARNTSEAVGAILATADRLQVLAGASETPRLREEEFVGSPFEVVERPWYEPLLEQVARMARGLRLGTDDRGLAIGLQDAQFLGPEIAELRYVLTADEVERYREIGRLTGVAIEAAARLLKPGMTEYEAAAALDAELSKRGLEPTVTLVAADERIRRFRHPIPTGNRIERYCMLITCARSGGLITAATRIVHFGPVPDDLRRRHQAVVQVEAAALAASRPGVPMGRLYETIAAAYAAQGFPGEERLHHQGGAIGYENREYLAAPGSQAVLHAPQAVAWNPTIAGTKSEDTYLLPASSNSAPECLTAGEGDWPLLEVETGGILWRRPDILVR